MPQGSLFSSSSRSKMNSSHATTQNQGGGDKKAGFPGQVGRESWTSVALRSTDPMHGHCCRLVNMQINLFPNASISKPIGSTYKPNTYFTVPGTR